MSNDTQNWSKILIELIVFWIIILGGCYLLRHENKTNPPQITEQRDTTMVTIYDTIPYIAPKPIGKKETKDSVAIAVANGHTPTVVNQDSLMAHNGHNDSTLTIYHMPREQVMYKDSTYQAWVSGVEPRLDSIKVYHRNNVNTITVVQKVPVAKRFGVGLQVGYGVCGNKMQPYIGIGISYNFFNW